MFQTGQRTQHRIFLHDASVQHAQPALEAAESTPRLVRGNECAGKAALNVRHEAPRVVTQCMETIPMSRLACARGRIDL